MRLKQWQVIVLILWILLCSVLTYWQLGSYARLFLDAYLARYFPFLGGFL
jgi:hypothetical protein